jgi:hypothetical protein
MFPQRVRGAIAARSAPFEGRDKVRAEAGGKDLLRELSGEVMAAGVAFQL